MVAKFIVDASVALKWQFKDEKETKEAIDMLTDFVDRKIELFSPSLFAYEIVNAIYVAMQRNRISEREGSEITNDILSLGIKLVDFNELFQQTFNFTKTYNRSAYDCSYLALAEKEKCPLYTADERLFNAIKNKFKYIKWIGDYIKLQTG